MTAPKSVLLIGNTKSKSATRLRQEAKTLGLVFEAVTPREVFCDSAGNLLVPFLHEKDVWSYDTYFFRGIGSSGEKLKTFIEVLQAKGKRVVEKCLFEKGGLPEDKFIPESVSHLYKFPDTKVVLVKDALLIFDDMVLPVVVKKVGVGSSMGKGVALIYSKAEFLKFCFQYNGLVQLQRYHTLRFDTRVLVVGGECLGGFNRYKNNGSFLTTERGGFRESAELTAVQKAAALEVTVQKGLEIAGVDMFYDEGELYVIEANASPQFMAFEKVTGCNVAEKILRYITQ